MTISGFSDYVRIGWKLCSIDKGKKAPTYGKWNTPEKAIPLEAADGLDGAGLLHSLSGTCCLDIDDLSAATAWLAEQGVDLVALLAADDAVQISSGRLNRAKLLYRMKRPLRTHKPKASGLELRCATADGKSVQDVLPPSVHPDTHKSYDWKLGILADWREPPPIPASLLSVWRNLGDEETLPPTQAAPRVDIAKLRKAAFKHSPDAEYPEWLKVGMQLHEGTNGAQEGFEIWCEWSKGIERKAYPGDALLKTHWLSFSTSGSGKHVATGAALAAELPAEAEEFPIEDLTQEGSTTEDVMRAALVSSRKAAYAELEKRLVFVHSVERYFDTERHKIIGSDNAIEHMFTHMMPIKKGGRQSPIKVLKESGTKQTVDAIGFHPGEDVIFRNGGDSFANTYRDRLPTPLEPLPDEVQRIVWLFDRIDDPTYRIWLLQFFGHVIQRPGIKIKAAPLIWSEIQGNGKTTILKMIPSLLVGFRYSKEVTFGLLNSDFNDYLLNAWHVNLTEFRAGTRGEREAVSKKIENWIADDALSINPKGMAGYTMPNHIFVTASSNKDDAAAIDNNDRKWAIHEMHAPQFTEAEQEWMYTEFLLTPRAPGVLRHYFLNVSLEGFVASAKAPETTARKEMVASSTSSDLELLQTAWEQNAEPLNRQVIIVNDTADYVRRHSLSKPSNHKVGRMLCRPPFDGSSIQFNIGTASYRGISLKNHAKWCGAPNPKIMANILKEDVDIAV